MSVTFDTTHEDREAVRKIAERAQQLYRDHDVERDLLDIQMDLIATHANGNRLDFEKLASFDDFNLLHDIAGIARHLDRETGELQNFFSPRSLAKN